MSLRPRYRYLGPAFALVPALTAYLGGDESRAAFWLLMAALLIIARELVDIRRALQGRTDQDDE